MKSPGLDQGVLRSRLKHLVADLCRPDLLEPDDIADDEPLITGRIGLDPLDALELYLVIEEEFGMAIPSGQEFHRAGLSIASLANAIRTGQAPAIRSSDRSQLERVRSRSRPSEQPRRSEPLPAGL